MQGRKIIALAVGAATLVALPAAADAKAKGPRFYKSGWEANARMQPTTGNTAKGAAFLRQHDGALTLALRVANLAGWAHYTVTLRAGTCAAPGDAQNVTIPMLIPAGNGVGKLWITLPTDTGADFAENGFTLDVADGASAVVTCGNINEHVAKGVARIRGLASGSSIKGAVVLRQTGPKVFDRVGLRGMTPNATYSTAIYAGTCAAIGTKAASLQNVIADANGKVAINQTTDPVMTDVVAPGMVFVVADASLANVACGRITGRFGPHPWAADGSPWWSKWWF